MNLHLIWIVFAFVFAVLATFNVPAPPRLNFVGAALACWFASMLFG